MLPAALRHGDTIGIVAPSNPVTGALRGQLERGMACLQRMGFAVRLGEHLRSATVGYAAAPLEKAADIRTMFADDSVAAILSAQGGDTANACLPYLDWNMIRAHPKIFMGISDITVLLNALYARAGLVTFHGDDLLWGLGRDQAPYTLEEFVERLVAGRIGPVRAGGPRATIRGGAAEGVLLGGNLPGLLKLAGTPYFPDLSGAILFVEAVDITPARCDHYFTQLKQMGVFGRLQGMLVGYIDGLENLPDQSIQMADVLLAVTAEYDFPILKVRDFGHNCPNTVLPVGGRVRMDADRQTYEIAGPCLRSEGAA